MVAARGDRGCRRWGGCGRGGVAAGVVQGAAAEVLVAAAGWSDVACCNRSCRFCYWSAVRTVILSMRARTRLAAFVNPICSGQTSIEREAVAALK